MTSVTTTMSNNEFWNKIAYDPLAYFDDFPANIINDLIEDDCFSPCDTIIKYENEETLSSPEVK
jgi:hypothetical protein